jgi:hypothetical protein
VGISKVDNANRLVVGKLDRPPLFGVVVALGSLKVFALTLYEFFGIGAARRKGIGCWNG